MTRRILGAILAVIGLSSCTGIIQTAGAEDPTALREQIAAVDGVSEVETAAIRTGWDLTLTLDANLDPDRQAAVIDEVYTLVDASDRSADLAVVKLALGPDRAIRVNAKQRLDTSNGLLEYLAQLPNHAVDYSDTWAETTVRVPLGDWDDLVDGFNQIITIPAPKIAVRLALSDPSASGTGSNEFSVAVDLPISAENQALFDQATKILSEGSAVGLSLRLYSDPDRFGGGNPQILWFTDGEDLALFDQMVALAQADPREIRLEAATATPSSTGQRNSYASQVA